jgi:hypothetical protein
MLISSNMDAKLSFSVLYPKFQNALAAPSPQKMLLSRNPLDLPNSMCHPSQHAPFTTNANAPAMDPRDEALQYCFLTTLFSLFVSSTPEFARFPMGFLPHCSLSSLGRDNP